MKATKTVRLPLLLLLCSTLALLTGQACAEACAEGLAGRSMRRFVFRLAEGVGAEAFGDRHGLRLVGQVGTLRRYYEYEATEATGERVVRRGAEWSDADPLEGSEWAAEQIPRVRVKRVIEGARDAYSEPQDPLYNSQV